MLNGYPEFLVTLESNEGTEILQLLDAKNVEDAIFAAFFSRNIASSWKIIAIESDDVDFSVTLPVTFEDYRNIDSSRKALRELVIGG